MICTIDESKYRISKKVVKEENDNCLKEKITIKKRKTNEEILVLKNPLEIREIDNDGFFAVSINKEEKSIELYKLINGKYCKIFFKKGLKCLCKLSDNVYFGQTEKQEALGSFFYLVKENRFLYPNVFYEVGYTRYKIDGHIYLEGKMSISKKDSFLKKTVKDTLIITIEPETICPVLIWSEEQQKGKIIPSEIIDYYANYSKKACFKEIANLLLNEDEYLDTLFKEKDELTKREKESIKLLLKSE